jgi:hypothetical protein
MARVYDVRWVAEKQVVEGAGAPLEGMGLADVEAANPFRFPRLHPGTGDGIYGRMFWFRRNRFVGSYVRLSARSRSYFASP